MKASHLPPFVERSTRRGPVARLLRRRVPEDALVEINNLFARASRVRNVSEEDVHGVLRRYGVELLETLPGDRAGLYREYLRYCLSDRHLSGDEIDDLDHLRTLLRLDPASIDLVHRRVAREVYSRSVDEVLADATVDDDERDFLRRVREHLAIPEVVAENIMEMKQRQRAARLPSAARSERMR